MKLRRAKKLINNYIMHISRANSYVMLQDIIKRAVIKGSPRDIKGLYVKGMNHIKKLSKY